MPTLAPALDPCVPVLTHRQPGPPATAVRRRYRGPVPTTANQVAAALREHLPHADGPRLHRLLYYVQGHHLALHQQPAFTDDIAAGTNGPEVQGLDDLTTHQPGTLAQGTLAVILTVAARYGGLTVNDLGRLTRAEAPWASTPAGRTIDHGAMWDFFTGPGRPDQPTHPLLQPDPARATRVREEVTRIHAGEATRRPDDLDTIAREVRGARR